MLLGWGKGKGRAGQRRQQWRPPERKGGERIPIRKGRGRKEKLYVP